MIEDFDVNLERYLSRVIGSIGEKLAKKWLHDNGYQIYDFQRIIWEISDLEKCARAREKGSLPRMFSNISGKLLNMLSNMRNSTDYVFGETTLNSLKATFSRSRKRLAYKLQNKRLSEIHFHTLRHWKATMEYHYKPDLLYVAEFLGHKEISNTRMYIQLEKNLFKNLPHDNFITRIAKNAKEACELIQVGFEYVTGEYDDGGKIFRKRK